MRLNLSLSQKALVLIAVPLAFQLIFVFILSALRAQVEQEELRQIHAREIYRHLDRMLRNVTNNSMESIISSVTRSIGYEDKEAQERLRALTQRIHEDSAAFKVLVQDNPDEAKSFAQFDILQQQLVARWNATKELMDSGNRVAALRAFKGTQTIAQKLFQENDRLSAIEHGVESTQIAAEAEHRDQIELLIRAAVLLNILLAVALAYFFNKGTTRRLNTLMDNTLRLASNMPLNPPLQGNDEIAVLDQTFQAMADALAFAARQERAIIDKTMDVICSISPANKFTRVSPAADAAWGYAATDLLGRNYLDLIADADKERAIAAMKEIRAGVREEPIETQVVRSDGRIVDTTWSARWSQEDQTMFCVAHDITARKQAENILKEAEARVRLIVESLPIGLAIIDRAGIIEFTNPCVKRMFGLSSAEMNGHHIGKLFACKNPVEQKQLNEQVGEPYKEFNEQLFVSAKNEILELEGVRFGGAVFPAEISLTEITATAGQRFLVVVIDTTQKHEVERTRQEFIAMVSHDLRTPLTSVQTFLDLLESGICGDLNDKGKKKLDSANRNIERLVDLIRDLLDLERCKSGIVIVNETEVSLRSIIDRSVEGVKMQAEHLGIEINVEAPELQIHADADRMVQAIVNLLSNSLKFSPAGSAITILGKSDSDFVELRLTDQGRGISRADQQRIFERFQQVKDEDGDFKRGTGLGLPICKAIIEQHGGTIGVESERGQGSTFWFRLPRSGQMARADLYREPRVLG